MGEVQREKVAVIIGPTAVGKTKLSIDLAKALNGEIISGDSMQIYRTMDIGTAKVTKEEMDGIPHYMVDIKIQKNHFQLPNFKNVFVSIFERLQSVVNCQLSLVELVCIYNLFYSIISLRMMLVMLYTENKWKS